MVHLNLYLFWTITFTYFPFIHSPQQGISVYSALTVLPVSVFGQRAQRGCERTPLVGGNVRPFRDLIRAYTWKDGEEG